MHSASVLERPTGSSTIARARDAATDPAAQAEAEILLLDGRPLLRDCLARALRAEWPTARIGTSSWEGLGAAAATRWDVCVVSLDGEGAAVLDRVAAAMAGTALVVLSDDDSYAGIAAAAGRGVRGYFSTSVDLPVLVQGLRLVRVGGTALPLPIAPAAQAPTPAPVPVSTSRFSAALFTPKELEVLGSLAAGRPNKLIAHELLICETTVKVHLRHIFRKLGTTNRTHAALLAREMLQGG